MSEGPAYTADMSLDQAARPGSWIETLAPLIEHWRLLLLGCFLATAVGLAATFVIAPIFTAQTTLLFPDRPQSSSSAALQSLGALAGIAGVGGGRNTTEQFAALLQSVNVQDRLIEQFKLVEVYDKRFKGDARRELDKRVRITVGKKDNLLRIEVDDTDPARAAALANQHVDELRRLTSTLAVTEAQQRRVFFETQLAEAQKKLVAAQQALEGSGFSQGALKAEPRAAAENYARLSAAVTAAQVRRQTLRGVLADGAIEVQQQQAELGALQRQLAQLEQPLRANQGPDYISKYRDFKYQETLFDLMARQYELARVDESREGALIQVVDVATPPERRSKPQRLVVTAASGLVAALALLLFVYGRDSWQRAWADPSTADTMARFKRTRRA